MRRWARGVLAGCAFGVGLTSWIAVPGVAAPRILPPCYLLPGPAAIAASPADAAPAGSHTAPAAPSLQQAAQQDVAWDPVRLLGYSSAQLIVDPVRDRLIAYGGASGYRAATGDVWARPLGGTGSWTRLVPASASPSGRLDAAAIYDPVRDRLIVYGGTCFDSCGAAWALTLSGAPTWSRVATADQGPGARNGMGAIYDPVGDRMIVFGGYSSAADSLMDDVWALSLAGTPAWTRLVPAGAPPSRRTSAAVVYDTRRRRMIVSGGNDSSDPYHYTIADVWVLSLGDSLAWTQLQPAGVTVPGVYGCASAYDAARDRMLVFGGQDSAFSDPPHAEAWALQLSDPLTWTRLAPGAPGPTARVGARGVYDAVRDRFVVFGGSGDDTWALSLGGTPAWSLLDAGDSGAPGGRYLPSLVYDPLRHRALFFGGETMYRAEGDCFYNPQADLWSLEFEPRALWRVQARDSVPAPRHGHTAVVDSAGDRMILFGGCATPTTPLPYDLWELPLADGQPWQRLAAAGTPPTGRWLHSAVFDAARRRMIVFGGFDGTSALDETWVLSLAGSPAWQRLDLPGLGPAARWGHGAVYDPDGDRMIVFGGASDSTTFDDTWQLSFAGTPAWSALPTAARPPARLLATMSFDPVWRCVAVVGGMDAAGKLLADAWTLPLANSTGWLQVAATGATPFARWGAASAFVASEGAFLYLQGTQGGGEGEGDAWTMSFVAPAAAQVLLRTVEPVAGGIELSWQAAASPGFTASVQRRTATSWWAEIGSVRADDAGRMRFEDRGVVRGQRYGYRLAWFDGAALSTSAETWQLMPLLPLLLVGATPNPSPRGLRVSLWLPDGSPAKLEALDVAGRRVASREIGALGAGPHVLDLDPAGRLPAAVYIVRLTHGSDVISARACVLR